MSATTSLMDDSLDLPSPHPTDDRVAKTYVWYKGVCYFVSTIERESSAMLGPRRFNETFVWLYDWAAHTRGSQVLERDDMAGSIRTHLRVVERLHKGGIAAFEGDDT